MGRLPFWTIVERTATAAAHFLLLFLIPILTVFVLGKLAAWANLQLHPPADPDAPGLTIAMVQRQAIESLLWARATMLPVRILEVLLAGLMARHVFVWWQKEHLSLSADAIVTGRNAVALGAIALLWMVLNFLAILPSVLLPPLPPPDWLDGSWGALLYIYVFMNPSYPVAQSILLALGILFCLAVPVAVLEERGVVAALLRSIRLTKGHRLRIFGLWLIYAALTWGIVFALGAGATRLQAQAPLPGPVSWTDITQAINVLIGSLLAVIGSTAIYYEVARHSATPQSTVITA